MFAVPCIDTPHITYSTGRVWERSLFVYSYFLLTNANLSCSLMLLSPTLQYSWSFPWQKTEQQFNPVGLTLLSWVCCQGELACFSFLVFLFYFSFSPPKSTQIVSFAAICSLPLGLMLLLRSPWHGLFRSAFAHLHFFSFWQPWSLPAHRSLQVYFRGSTSPSLSSLSFLQATLQYFLPKHQILSSYRESTCRSFTLLACLTTSAKYVCEKTAFYGKWAPQWASQTQPPLCELSLPSGGGVMLLQWTFIWL